MKIAFSGPHQVGKTSLAERFALENDLIMYYTNVKKTFKKKSVKEMENLSGKEGFYERINQQEEIKEHLKKKINEGESFSVFDRSFIDVYAYSEFYLSKILKTFIVSKEDIWFFNHHLSDISNNFDAIDFTFIVQPGIQPKDNNGSGSLEFQEPLNEVFLDVVKTHLQKNKYFIIPKEITDFEERIRLCNDVYKKLIDNKNFDVIT